jgi:predicted membrane channel-forming protein YqfA (hemolysin III family)
MTQNYMLVDIAETVVAAIVFSLMFLPPGFVLGWASNMFGFRARSAVEKILISIVLSAATVPVIAVLVGRFFSLTGVVVVVLLLALAAAALAWKKHRPNWGVFFRASRSTWSGLGMMAVWSVLAILSLMDLQLANRLYVSTAIYDHSVRIPFVEAVARTGVPPLNPFYGLGKIPVLRYYYYWYVVCALPEHLAGLSARSCFAASVMWSGFSLAALIPLYLKYFFKETVALRRKSLICISLLLVTGLDLIPCALKFLTTHLVEADMEWWDPNQVTSWLDSLIWVPHHVAALTACMAGFLVLSAQTDKAELRDRVWAGIIAGLAFASAAGLSVYVAFVFLVFAAVWSVILAVKKRIREFFTFMAAAGVLLLVSVPYLLDLHTQSKVGQRFAIFAIRDIPLGL